TAIVPPTFDSPTTRGLFDSKTGVYWSVDSLGTPVPYEVTDVAELDADFVRAGFLAMQRGLSPWHRWVAPGKFDAHPAPIASLGATVVPNAHGPALRGDQITSALALAAELPHLPPVDLPGQAALDAILATFTVPTSAAAAA